MSAKKSVAKPSVAAGSDGRTPKSKMQAERNEKLAAARAAQSQTDAAAKALDTEAIADAVVRSKPKAKKIPAALNLVPTPKPTNKGKAAKTVTAPTAKAEPVTVPAGSKLCRKCSTVKPLAEFAKDKSSKDGAYSQCKSCEAAWRAARKAASAA